MSVETAFQVDAFQNDAFQIEEDVGVPETPWVRPGKKKDVKRYGDRFVGDSYRANHNPFRHR
jgi:hypothetical protein